jgi:hypothetical protein
MLANEALAINIHIEQLCDYSTFVVHFRLQMDPQFANSFDRGQLSIDWNSRQNDSFPTTIGAASSAPQGMYLEPSLLDSRLQFLPSSSFLLHDPDISPEADIPARPWQRRLEAQYLQGPLGSATGSGHGPDLVESSHFEFSRLLVDDMGLPRQVSGDVNDGRSYHPLPILPDAVTVDMFSSLGHLMIHGGQVPDQMSIFEGNNSLNLPPTLFAGGPLVELNQPSFDHGQPQRPLDNSASMTDNVSQLSVPGGRAFQSPQAARMLSSIQGDLSCKPDETCGAMYDQPLSSSFIASQLKRM